MVMSSLAVPVLLHWLLCALLSVLRPMGTIWATARHLLQHAYVCRPTGLQTTRILEKLPDFDVPALVPKPPQQAANNEDVNWHTTPQ